MKLYLHTGISQLYRRKIPAECDNVQEKEPIGKVAISKNRDFLAWVSYMWPTVPGKMGISRTTLVGRLDCSELKIFVITFSMRFDFLQTY